MPIYKKHQENSQYFIQIGPGLEVNNGEYPYWSTALTPTSVRPDVPDAQSQRTAELD